LNYLAINQLGNIYKSNANKNSMKILESNKEYHELSEEIVTFMTVLPTVLDFLKIIKQKRNTMDVRAARTMIEGHLGILNSRVEVLNDDLIKSKFIVLRNIVNLVIKEFFILETLVAASIKNDTLISSKINIIKDLNSKLKLELRNFNNVSFQKINELREAA
jgi:hypothetical protein